MKIKFYFIAILLIVLIFGSCSDKRHFVRLEYNGTVYDSTHINPIKNCIVVLEGRKPNAMVNGVHYFEIRRVYTNDDGSFEINDWAARSNVYRITFYKQGYLNIIFENVKGKDLKSGKYSTIYFD